MCFFNSCCYCCTFPEEEHVNPGNSQTCCQEGTRERSTLPGPPTFICTSQNMKEIVNFQYQRSCFKILNRFSFTETAEFWAWRLRYTLHCPTASALKCIRCIPAQASRDNNPPAEPQPVRCLIGAPRRQAWAARGSRACRWSSHPVLHKTHKQMCKKAQQENLPFKNESSFCPAAKMWQHKSAAARLCPYFSHLRVPCSTYLCPSVAKQLHILLSTVMLNNTLRDDSHPSHNWNITSHIPWWPLHEWTWTKTCAGWVIPMHRDPLSSPGPSLVKHLLAV